MRRMTAVTAFLLAGCAALPILGQLGLQRMSVSVPSELPFPDELTLKMGGAASKATALSDAALAALGQESVELQLGKALKKAALPLRQRAAQGFREELEKAQLFGSVVETGGNVGMAISVSRWGLTYDPATKGYQLVLDLQASLSEPHWGVLWKGERSAAQLSALAKQQIGKIDITALIARPEGYQDLMGIAARDLSKQLVDDLKANPPKLPSLQGA